MPVSEEGTVLHLGGNLGQARHAGMRETMRFEVEVRTLDSYAFKEVRAIKVDVEGSEMEVLEGARETILRDRPPLIVELLTGAHADPVALTETICATYGYSAWLVTKDRARVEALPVMRRPRHQHHLGLADPQSQRAVSPAAVVGGKRTHDHRHRPDPRGPDRQLPCRPRRGLPRARLSGLPGGTADRDRPASSCAAISPRGHPQLVALEGERVVGWCDVTPVQRPTMRHGGVLGMGLLPDWRGRGLGERLIRQTLEAARAFGFSRVELTVRHDNARAQALYRKVGFEAEGRKRRAILVDGVFYDLVVMALLFDADGEQRSRGLHD